MDQALLLVSAVRACADASPSPDVQQRAKAHEVVDLGDDVRPVGSRTGADMLRQDKRAGFKDRDLQAALGQFDSGRHATRATADDQAVDGSIGDGACVAQQDGS